MWPFKQKKQIKKKSPLRFFVKKPARSSFVQRKRALSDYLFFHQYERLLRFSSRYISKEMLFGCISVIIFGIAFGILFFSSFFQVKDVAFLRDSPFIPIDKYKQEVQAYIGKNMLFVSTKDLEQFLVTRYPELSQVRVRKLFPQTLQVQLVTQKLFSRLKVLGGSDDFFLTTNGMVLKNETGDSVENINKDLPLIELPLYEELKDAERQQVVNALGLKVGNKFLSPAQIVIIGTALDIFKKNFHHPIQKVVYRPLEKEIWLQLKENSVIFLTIDPLEKSTIETQLYKLKQDEGELALEKGELAYVDLRIIDKVLFCRKGKQCEYLVRGINNIIKK